MSITTKIHEISILDLEDLQSSPDNVLHLPINKNDIIRSLVFAFEATGNIQYLNDIITLEENLDQKKVA